MNVVTLVHYVLSRLVSLWTGAFHFWRSCWWWIGVRCSMGCEFAVVLPDFKCNQLLGSSSLNVYLWFLVSSVDLENIKHGDSFIREYSHFISIITVPFSLPSVDVFCLFTQHFRRQEIWIFIAFNFSSTCGGCVSDGFLNKCLIVFYFSAITVSNVLLWVFCLFHFQRFLIFGLLSTVLYLPRFTSGLISRICRQRVSDTSSTVPIFPNGFYNFVEIAAQIEI